jgi:hypothetical protein
MYVLPDELVKELILAIEGDTTIFPAGFLVRLYTNNQTPDKGSVVGDFEELTNIQVPGYAAVAGGWVGAPVRKQDGSWEDQGAAPLAFAASTAPPAPIPVYGWFATNAAGTVLIGAGIFEAPFTFALPGDGLSLEQVIRVIQANGTDYTLTLDMEIE